MVIPDGISITILTEDSGRDGSMVVERFARRLIRYVCPAAETNRITVDPTERAIAKGAVGGNRWRSKAPGDRFAIVSMLKHLATKLAQSWSLVFFHYDADVVWGTVTPTAAQFDTLVRARVRTILLDQFPEDVEAVDAWLTRLVEVVPHYSIEAWAYQNTTVLRRECARSHGSAHDSVYAVWESDPALLDDVHQPKNASCAGSKFNLECLDTGFPWQRLVAANKSFVAIGARMKSIPEVVRVVLAIVPR